MLVLIAVLVLGCSGSKSFKYEGEWMGNRNIPASPDMPETVRYTAGRVTLTIKESKFEMTQAGVPTGGEVAYHPDHVELTTKTYMERPIDHQGKDAHLMHPIIHVTPQPDGSILVDDP